MEGARGGFAAFDGPVTATLLPQAAAQPALLRGWVLPPPGTTEGAGTAPMALPEIAIQIEDATIQVITAALPPGEEGAPPPEALGFAWPLPRSLMDGRPRLLRAFDLQRGRELAGSPMRIRLDPSPMAARAALDHWTMPLAGQIVAAQPTQLAEDLWLSLEGPATRLLHALIIEAGRRGVKVLAEDRAAEISLHFRPDGPMPPAGIPTPIRTLAWLPRASETIAWAHGETWLTRFEGTRFVPLRRLRRGRLYRRPGWLLSELVLSPAEASQEEHLWLTITARASNGLCALPPEFAAAPKPAGTRMEDARLEGSFGALVGSMRAHRGAVGDTAMALPRAPARPLLPAMPVGAEHPPTQVIIPVHNGDVIVRDCLRALRAAITGPSEIVILDDGSREHTAALLRAEAAADRRFVLHRRDVNRGYTKTINEGVMLTESPFVVILNSDTLVCPGWLDRLHAAFRARPHTGLVGPLSNAASWQSIPQTMRRDGSWSTNDAIGPEDRFRVQALLDRVSTRSYPDFPLLNGFCTLIAREVFDTVGLFDEDAFPVGYGEETDLCLRARRAGFGLTVADDCFVYHHKSVSFGSATRQKLAQAGGFEMRNKHLGITIPALEEAMQACPSIALLRIRLAEMLGESSEA